MSDWIKSCDQEPPKDKLILTKTLCYGSRDLLLIEWIPYFVKGKDHGYWQARCGCLGAEDCIIGDIIEWKEVEE